MQGRGGAYGHGGARRITSQISVRLPSSLAHKLEVAAEERRADRSEIIRDALRLYLEGRSHLDSPWERIGDLAGAASGGPSDLASRHRAHLKEILGGP